jgi:hypothetical protein
MSFLILDSSTQRFVSIKIVVASESKNTNHELEILQHLQANDPHSHPGRSNVTQLLDSFFHEGPNGRHLCVVLELLGPTLFRVAEQSQNHRLKADLARRVSGHVVKAVAYLHSCGVAHGGEDILLNVETQLSDLIRPRHTHEQHSLPPAAVGYGEDFECFRVSLDRESVQERWVFP